MPFPFFDETKDLDDETRTGAAGSFVTLSDGVTHYELSGPERRPIVVLIHGFSTPYFIWEPTFKALTGAGFRVLRYDLFGRGYSDRPRLKYNLDLFVRQLHDLLDALSIAAPVNLIGLSMGGFITAAFTVQFPERVNKLILIDPVGTHSVSFNPLYKIALLPGVSESLLSLAGTERIAKRAASDFFDPDLIEMFKNQYRVQMQFRGFGRAILSTLRNKVVDGSPEIYQQLGKLSTPVLLIWGRNDHTLPLEQSRSILNLVPRAEYHVIEGAGHIPHYEQPEQVNPLLIRFLR